MVAFDVPEVDYTEYTDRQLAAIPLALLALSLLVIAGWYVMTGSPVIPGIAFTGGTEIRIATSVTEAQLKSTLSIEAASITPIRNENTYIVAFQSTNTEAITEAVRAAGYEVLSVQRTSASFGAEAQRVALIGIAVAFVGMSLLVFGLYRTFVPSAAVVLAAFSNIMIPLALMNLLGIKLSLGTVAALLMLIGYSVDSDILLTNHVLKRRGGFYESTYRARRTGVTMTVTSIAAVSVMAIVATYFAIPLLPQMGKVLAFGLTADLMNTWLLNVSLLRWYKFEGVTR